MTKEVVKDIKEARYNSMMDQIRTLVKANAPLIYVRTHEEDRFLQTFHASVAEKLKREAWVWSAAQGIVPWTKRDSVKAEASGPLAGTNNPMKALEVISATEPSSKNYGCVYLMRDFHIVMQEPVPRKLRDMYNLMLDKKITIIVVSPVLAHGAGGQIQGLPPTLEKQMVVVDYELPAREYIENHLRELVQVSITENTPKEGETATSKTKKEQLLKNLEYTDQDYFDFSRALQGLTEVEIDTACSSCLQHCMGINIDFLLATKKQIVSRGEILEYIDVRNDVKDIGGLDLAKSFFQDYAGANSPEAEAYGVEPLRGALLVGVPGTGKSALSKTVPTLWRLPLLRLDVGKVMTGLVGGSEGKMRQVIQQVEAVAPCVLWIDEVEKALSGTKSSNMTDGGTMARVFGTLLTAMEEGLKGVTFIATANDISALPPEFIRRFSETFFVDLPGPDERKEIFGIHLTKRKRDPKKFNLDTLVENSKDYTGAEIEKSIKRSLAMAFTKKTEVTTEHVVQALKETKPISSIMHEKIEKLRKDAHGRFRYASSWAEKQGELRAGKKKEMSLDNLEVPSGERKKVKAPDNDAATASRMNIGDDEEP